MEPVENLLKATLMEIEKLLTTRSVVGDPITVEGHTLIPLVSVGFGFGVGGGSGRDAKSPNTEGGGSGSGGGGGVKPVAVVVVGKDGVRLDPVRGSANLVDKLGEAVGKIIDRRAGQKGDQTSEEKGTQPH